MNEKKTTQVFVQGAIPVDFIAKSIAKHSAKKNIGAHSIFLGQIRNDTIENRQVHAIEYIAYEEMANIIFHDIREDMFAKYDLTCMHIFHSLGRVQVGEISLFVFTSSAHRDSAIEACQEIVERIKKDSPIWGKEIFEDETHVWKQSTI